jgi:hypothetical protein
MLELACRLPLLTHAAVIDAKMANTMENAIAFQIFWHAEEVFMDQPAYAAAIAAEQLEGEAKFLNKVVILDRLAQRGRWMMAELESGQHDESYQVFYYFLYYCGMLISK